jgi:hypothetical protein
MRIHLWITIWNALILKQEYLVSSYSIMQQLWSVANPEFVATIFPNPSTYI